MTLDSNLDSDRRGPGVPGHLSDSCAAAAAGLSASDSDSARSHESRLGRLLQASRVYTSISPTPLRGPLPPPPRPFSVLFPSPPLHPSLPRSLAPSLPRSLPRSLYHALFLSLPSFSLSGPAPPHTGRRPQRPRRALPAFGIASNTLVRSRQSSSGPAGGASYGCHGHGGLGRGAAGPDRRCTTAAAGALESSFRTDPAICPIMLRHRYR